MAVVFLGTVLASPLPASARGTFGRFSYTGDAYGTAAKVLGGTVVSGPTARVTIGCTDMAGMMLSNTVASVTAPPLVGTDTVTTTATTSDNSARVQSKTTAVTQGVNLLDGTVTADTILAVSATSFDSGGFHTSGAGSNLVNLVVAGNSVGATPAPNTMLDLPGLGTITLNEQNATMSGGAASLTVNMIHIVITIPNSLAAVGTDIKVSHATSDLEGPVLGVVDGHAYGTSAQVGTVVRSGPTALVGVGCLGTNGRVDTNTMAGVNIPDTAATGTITDTATATVTATSATSETTATVQALNLVSGLVTADVVTADAHASSDGTTKTFSDSGSTFANLVVVGHPELSVNVPPNTQLAVPQLGTLYLHRVIQGTAKIEVRMVELVVGANNFGLPVGLDVRIAVAEASVH